jgi:hypothetical protein
MLADMGEERRNEVILTVAEAIADLVEQLLDIVAEQDTNNKSAASSLYPSMLFG